MTGQKRSSLILVCGFVLIAFPAVANSALGTDQGLDSKLQAQGWKELLVGSTPPNEYQVLDNQHITVRSNDSVSILYRKLTIREQNLPAMTWQWRVDKSVPATDPGLMGFDDRDLAVHVWFENSEDKGVWNALKRTFINVLGYPSIGNVLTYTFGGTGERFRTLDNPHHDPEGKIIVLRPSGSKTGVWFEETINFRADFKRVFGKQPPKPKYVAISADSDDTHSQGFARIAPFEFLN